MQPTERYATSLTLTDNAPPAGTRPAPIWLRVPLYMPRVTNILLVVLIGVFAIEVLYSDNSLSPGNDLQTMHDLGAKINVLILNGEWWRLITAMFLHADILHIGFNAYALLIFGPQVERFFAWWRFLAIYLLGGLAGSIASFAFSPAYSVGASGAIFGLLGASGAFFWTHRRLLGAVARTMLWNAVAIAGLNLVLGLAQASAIDNWAHGGGLLGGLITGLALAPRYRPGRVIGPDERMLEDSLPRWAAPAIVMAILAVEMGLFVVALAVQKGLL